MNSINIICFKPWIPRNYSYNYKVVCPKRTCYRKSTKITVHASLQDSQSPNNTTQQQNLNLSVLRFTLGIASLTSLYTLTHVCKFEVVLFFILVFVFASGIPGLDESYLPRWIGYAFGSLLLLNHFLGSDSATVTLPQLVR